MGKVIYINIASLESSMKKVMRFSVLISLIAILLCSLVAAEITFRGKIGHGQSKLYQSDTLAYSLELVWIDVELGQARFFVNQKELTDVFDDKYTTEDNSTIQILEIEIDEAGGSVYEIYFYGSLQDPLEFDEGEGFRARRVMSAFDYKELYTESEIAALGLPTEKTDAKYITDAPTRTARVMVTPGREAEEKRVELEAKRSTFNFSWMTDLLAWVKGLFRPK